MIPPNPFIFIRHGQTEGNARDLCQGKIDYPLTELGKLQAKSAAKKIMGFLPIRRIYSSDLGRARETAVIIAEEIACRDIVFLEGLQERGYGILEGASNVPMFEQEKREAQEGFREPSGIHGLEERSDFHKRIISTLEQILISTPDEVTLIVGHGRFFSSLSELMGVEPIQQIANGGPVFCDVHEDAWRIKIL